MKFKEFITRYDKIRSECKPFLQVTHLPLYRGVTLPFYKPFVIAKVEQVRKDRRPRDSSPYSHKLMDDWFNEHYGIRPRSQGLFCTGDPKNAKQYGAVAYAFPVGKFKFIWGVIKQTDEPVHDLLTLSNIIRSDMKFKSEKEAPQVTENVLKIVHWRMDNLQEAQKSGAEIVIMCDEVVLVPRENYRDYNELLEKLI